MWLQFSAQEKVIDPLCHIYFALMICCSLKIPSAEEVTCESIAIKKCKGLRRNVACPKIDNWKLHILLRNVIRKWIPAMKRNISSYKTHFWF